MRQDLSLRLAPLASCRFWQRLHEVLLTELHGADRIDWSRALVDRSMLKAPLGGDATGPNPTDRRKLGSKHHIVADARGIPLAASLTKANAPDITQLLPLVDAIPAVRGRRGRPRRRPASVPGDRGYDSEPHREELRRRHIKPVLARRRTGHGSGLGVYRWFVGRTLSWLHQFGRLRFRPDRLPELQVAWSLACSLICLRFVTDSRWSFFPLDLDDYGIHDSLQVRLASATEKGRRLKFHFLPPYCPDHNRIERVWEDLHANVTRNHRCRTTEELMEQVKIYLHSRDQHGHHCYPRATAV